MKEIIQGSLVQDTLSKQSTRERSWHYFKNMRWTEVGGYDSVACPAFVHLHGTVVVDSLCSGYLGFNQSSFLRSRENHTISQSNRCFSRSRLYLSNRGHIFRHVPTIVIASSNRFGTRGSSILPSAIACFRSASRAFTS